jgi:hypothetical protein
VPHVELSLVDLGFADPVPAPTALQRWARAVVAATEPCLLIDADAVIVAASASCQRLFGSARPLAGRPLLDGAVRLLDFSPDGGALTDNEVGKIPPLLALSSGRLARGLIRVECAGGACTLDAIATPIGEAGVVRGSLTFFSPV